MCAAADARAARHHRSPSPVGRTSPSSLHETPLRIDVKGARQRHLSPRGGRSPSTLASSRGSPIRGLRYPSFLLTTPDTPCRPLLRIQYCCGEAGLSAFWFSMHLHRTCNLRRRCSRSLDVTRHRVVVFFAAEICLLDAASYRDRFMPSDSEHPKGISIDVARTPSPPKIRRREVRKPCGDDEMPRTLA